MKSKIFFFIIGCLLFTSCLKYNLDEIENTDLCAIVSITFEHRWIVQNNNGYDVLCRRELTISKNAPDADNKIVLTITVPPASGTAYNSFSAAVREKVTIGNLYLYSILSPAAKIEPMGDTPAMGLPASFEIGKAYEYKVTAANGNFTVYSIVINDFIK
ncbi:MAG: hypothetical protein LBG96_11380 [Tannerella sp.]|jgi:hypothetical protein|nr:hypothetical protein [Tannerella sp.]